MATNSNNSLQVAIPPLSAHQNQSSSSISIHESRRGQRMESTVFTQQSTVKMSRTVLSSSAAHDCAAAATAQLAERDEIFDLYEEFYYFSNVLLVFSNLFAYFCAVLQRRDTHMLRPKAIGAVRLPTCPRPTLRIFPASGSVALEAPPAVPQWRTSRRHPLCHVAATLSSPIALPLSRSSPHSLLLMIRVRSIDFALLQLLTFTPTFKFVIFVNDKNLPLLHPAVLWKLWVYWTVIF